MIDTIITSAIQIGIVLAILKLFFTKKPTNTTETVSKTDRKSIDWEKTISSIEAFEERINQLQAREIKNKERIWALEDENNTLRDTLALYRKEKKGEDN